MKKYLKLTSAFISTGILIAPFSSTIINYNNIAKAQNENKIINSRYIDSDEYKEKENNNEPTEIANSKYIDSEEYKENENKDVIGEDRDVKAIIEFAISIIELGINLDNTYFKSDREEWEKVKNKYNGWVNLNLSNGKSLWFYKDNGKYKNGWHWDSYYNGWYYFYEVKFYVGEPNFSKNIWYANVMYDPNYNDKWLKLNNKWYEFENGGKLIQHSGWRKYNNKWLYHIPGDYGAIASQSRYIDGKWYTFDSNGYWV